MTPAQLSTLKADIVANTATIGGVQIKDLLNTPDNNNAIAVWYNGLASPDFLVWRTDASVKEVYDAITWASYTPQDVADNTVIYSNRLLLIQTKQMNLQNMLVGRDSIDATKANLRAGLRDAVTALPAGVSGANVSAGGVSGATVLNTLLRKATRLEKLLATGSATTGTVAGNLMGFEGATSETDILNARNS